MLWVKHTTSKITRQVKFYYAILLPEEREHTQVCEVAYLKTKPQKSE
jgi:hypothetical protein